jgi:hypothetical protein
MILAALIAFPESGLATDHTIEKAAEKAVR